MANITLLVMNKIASLESSAAWPSAPDDPDPPFAFTAVATAVPLGTILHVKMFPLIGLLKAPSLFEITLVPVGNASRA